MHGVPGIAAEARSACFGGFQRHLVMVVVMMMMLLGTQTRTVEWR